MNSLSFVTNQNNGLNLCFEGFEYHKNKKIDGLDGVVQYWVCQHRLQTHPLSVPGQKRRHQICSAVIHTTERNGETIIKKGPSEHSCRLVDAMQRARSDMRNSIRSIASTSTQNPARILQDFKVSKTLEQLECLPSDMALKRTIQRVRKRSIPPEPICLNENAIIEAMKNTISGVPFYRTAIVVEGKHNFIFATDDHLKLLEESPFWMMDGTFQTVPHLLYQLYTIHGRVGRSEEDCTIVPLVYILMESKEQICYEDVFSYIESQMENTRARYMISDFEIAAINAIRTVFPEIQPAGCYFHLQQAFLRHLKSCGLQTLFLSNIVFAQHFYVLGALAFLPAEQIPDAFLQLKAKFQESFPDVAQLEEFLVYVSNTYVQGRPRGVPNNGVQRYIPPRFPPALWTVHERTNLGFPRTQNNVESWNNRWKHLLEQKHVGVHRCVEELRKEEHIVSSKVHNGNLSGFMITTKRKLLLERENSLKEFLGLREEMERWEFLQSLALRLHDVQMRAYVS